MFVNALMGFHIGFAFQSCSVGVRTPYAVVVL
jgi:hypothetical protein